VSFSVFSAKTTLYRYHVRGGNIKPKDKPKLARLKQHIEQNGSEQLPDSYYQPYLDFVAEIHQKYPFHVAMYAAFWSLDARLNGKISGSSGFLKNLICLFTQSETK